MALWEVFEAQDESFSGFSTNPFDIDGTDQVRCEPVTLVLDAVSPWLLEYSLTVAARTWDAANVVHCLFVNSYSARSVSLQCSISLVGGLLYSVMARRTYIRVY